MLPHLKISKILLDKKQKTQRSEIRIYAPIYYYGKSQKLRHQNTKVFNYSSIQVSKLIV